MGHDLEFEKNCRTEWMNWVYVARDKDSVDPDGEYLLIKVMTVCFSVQYRDLLDHLRNYSPLKNIMRYFRFTWWYGLDYGIAVVTHCSFIRTYEYFEGIFFFHLQFQNKWGEDMFRVHGHTARNVVTLISGRKGRGNPV